VPRALVLTRAWRTFRQFVSETFRSGVPSYEFLNAITDLTTLVGQGFKLAGSQTAQTGGIFEFAAP
jgi:hypothetical protein